MRIPEELVNQAAALLPRLLAGLGVWLAFWIGSRALRLLLRRATRHKDAWSQEIWHLIEQVIVIVLLAFGAVTTLGTVGINVTALVAGLGLTGFAMGFALKDALSNMLAGVLLVIYRPFKLYDYISIAGFEGIVTHINLRYTGLQSAHKEYLIPNSMMFTNPVNPVIIVTDEHARQERGLLETAARQSL